MSSSQTRETTPTRVPAWLYPWYSSDNNDDSVRASTDLLIQLLVDVLRSSTGSSREGELRLHPCG